MAKDRREDAGQFYPGGNVVPRGPVTPGGGTPADYPTVRTNAAKGAEHAAEKGNPHDTTAGQVGAYTKDEVNAALKKKQDNLSQSQLEAVNSGATKAKIDEIDDKLDKSGGTLTGSVVVKGDGSSGVFAESFVAGNAFMWKDMPWMQILVNGDEWYLISKSKAGGIATTSEIAAATNLTPVYGEWVFSGGGVDRSKVYRLEYQYDVKAWYLYDGPEDDDIIGAYESNEDDQLTIDTFTNDRGESLDIAATRFIVGYKLGAKTAETDPTLNGMSVAQITTLAEAAVENKAVGEIEAANGKLVVKDDGGAEQFNSEKAVRYELASASSTTFKDMAINYLVIAATESTDPIQQAVTIPTASVDGRAIDFIVDVTCNHAAGAVLQPSDSDIVLLPEADAVDNITISGGERALITFTQLPGTKTFMVAKKVLVEPQEA